jgi:hypothetical protein
VAVKGGTEAARTVSGVALAERVGRGTFVTALQASRMQVLGPFVPPSLLMRANDLIQ